MGKRVGASVRVTDETVSQWLSSLRYIMTAPGLISGLPGGCAPLLEHDDVRLQSLIDETVRTPSGLAELVESRRSYKVGPAFEALIQYGIEAGLGYTCLGWDVQVFKARQTIGALDLIVRSPQGQVEHWELAYKLYLQSGASLEWDHWVGPNEHDRLAKKIHRLMNHQLPLSGREEATAPLKTLGADHIDKRRVILQGALFHHFRNRSVKAVGATEASRGIWVHVCDVSELVSQLPGYVWSRRHKPHWFGPWTLTGAGMSGESMLRCVRAAELSRPQLWVAEAPFMEPGTHCGIESSASGVPVFIVPNRWGQGGCVAS